jgi:colanic acid/amylovoran biosynthesis glycosyltransferase
MRLAMFTNKFPIKGDTFFARDLRALMEAGITVDVFPMHPIDETAWQWIPEILNEKYFRREQVRETRPADFMSCPRKSGVAGALRFTGDAARVMASALSFGAGPAAKSAYALGVAWAWAARYGGSYDHIMSYWGNFAATCAHVAHRLAGRDIPVSMLLHAGTDLYRTQVFMEEKLRYADNIFVVCDFNKEFLRARFPALYPEIERKIQLHHLGLDFRELTFEREGRKEHTVLCVGRFDRLKGFDYVLRAVKALEARGIFAAVELVGDGDQGDALRALARESGMGDRVTFLGWRPFAEVQAAMKRATILVHASADIGDAVPTVIKEATALGTPVIGTTVAGIPELLEYGTSGLLVPPRDVPALADAIEKFLRDPALRDSYARAARTYTERKFDLWANGRLLARRLESTTRSTHGSL